MPRRVSPLIALVALLAWTVAARGQEATPAVGPGALPVTPDPAECVGEPRTLAEIRELADTPPDGAPAADATPAATSRGEPADAETIAGITATVRRFVACVNAGDELRGYALYTDEFIRSSVLPDPALAQPAVAEPPDERVTLLAVVYVRHYPDARVGAVVVIDDPLAPSPAEPYFFVFIEDGDRWLFAEWPTTIFLGDADGGSGTRDQPSATVTAASVNSGVTPTPEP